jgi:hypothetical protein
MANGAGRRVLEIYVMPECIGCKTARGLAAAVRALALPDLEVSVVDLSEPDVVRPSAVFAVPTYLLDGRIISLGNPEEGWLLAQIGLRTDPACLTPGASH